MENLDLEKILEEEIFRIIRAIITIKCDYNISYKARVDMINEYANVIRICSIIENREDKKIISRQYMEKINIKTKSQIWRKIQKPKIERLNQYLDEKTITEHTVWDNSRERQLIIPQQGITIKVSMEKKIKSYGKDK